MIQTDKPHKPGTNGLGQCPHCGRGVHGVVQWQQKCPPPAGRSFVGVYLRHDPIPRLRVIPDRARTNCSKCDKPGEWYEFKPGSGECTECQT